MRYAMLTLALAALSFGAAMSHAGDRKATAAETASVAEALGGEGCVLSDEVETNGGGIFEAGGVVCEDGSYDVELDAGYNIISRTKVGPADGPE